MTVVVREGFDTQACLLALKDVSAPSTELQRSIAKVRGFLKAEKGGVIRLECVDGPIHEVHYHLARITEWFRQQAGPIQAKWRAALGKLKGLVFEVPEPCGKASKRFAFRAKGQLDLLDGRQVELKVLCTNDNEELLKSVRDIYNRSFPLSAERCLNDTFLCGHSYAVVDAKTQEAIGAVELHVEELDDDGLPYYEIPCFDSVCRAPEFPRCYDKDGKLLRPMQVLLRSMLNTVTKNGKPLRQHKVQLHVETASEPAVRLYKSLGFVIHKTIKDCYGPPFEPPGDAHLMYRPPDGVKRRRLSLNN